MPSPIFDTHCHYNLEPLTSDWQHHWQLAQNQGVSQSLVAGTSLASSEQAIKIAAQATGLSAAIGVHPHEYKPNDQEVLSTTQTALETLITEHPAQIKAVGETGLDYFRLDPNQLTAKQTQQSAFIMHLHLAQTHQLPVIVHVRDRETPEDITQANAYWDALKLLRENWRSDQPMILHCVSGPLNYIRQALNLGAYIGVAGNVTYQKAEQLREIVRMTPVDRLLLETDAPFLPPSQHRGEVCQPWMIQLTAKYLEKELAVNLNQVWQNSLRVFSS